jgi:hypothetical protein
MRWFFIEPYSPANDCTIVTIAGTDENATVMVPNRPKAKLEKAAALGSVTNNKAVAIAEEFVPRDIPLVM